MINDPNAPGIEENSLRYYPNPSEGIFNMEYDFSYVSGTSMIIVNSLGSVVYSNSSELPLKIDLSGQAKGVYFMKLNYKNSVLVKKLILQ